MYRLYVKGIEEKAVGIMTYPDFFHGSSTRYFPINYNRFDDIADLSIFFTIMKTSRIFLFQKHKIRRLKYARSHFLFFSCT